MTPKKVTVKQATKLAFKMLGKVLKDLAYYDKHGKLPEDK